MTSVAAQEEYPVDDREARDASELNAGTPPTGPTGPKRTATVTAFDETNVVMCRLAHGTWEIPLSWGESWAIIGCGDRT